MSGWIDLGPISRTNRGNLLSPAIDLRATEAVDGLFETARLQPGEWVLTFIEDGPCGTECRQVLDKLLTIRSLLGYSGQRVRVIALSELESTLPLAANHTGHVLTDPAAHSALTERLVNATGTPLSALIVFIDWRRQLVVRYDRDAAPEDLKKDLKKLLRASQIR